MRALMQMGFWITSDREYPSLIKWWQANVNINFADVPLRWASRLFQIWLGMGLEGLTYCLEHVAQGGTIVHNFERREEWIPEMQDIVKKKGYTIHYIPSREYVLDSWLHTLYENSLVIWAAAKVLGIPYKTIHTAFKHTYGKKEKLRAQNESCLQAGFDLIESSTLKWEEIKKTPQRMFVDGNTTLAMWAIHAWVRTYFAYPMSPSSSILWYFATTAMETGILVKQVEDEITAIQMALWSMYTGTRSLTATSGWWFDLMSETISLSGMIEVPCVCVIAQRPGPATWLPTWTAQWDLLLATYAGHGEFARIVIWVADSVSAYKLIQHAFNLAEEFHIPVIVLTEKLIAENRQTIPMLEQWTIPITRWLVTNSKELKNLKPSDRYKITESWVSKRRIPTTSETISYTNGDEHHEDGTLDETEWVGDMIAKRVRKTETILQKLPDPELYWAKSGKILYIWRWSTLGLFQDIIEYDKPEWVSYLHIAYLWPLKVELIEKLAEVFDQIIVIENNTTGQLHTLLSQQINKDIDLQKFLKRNGRQFCIEEILEHIEKNSE